MAKTFIILVFAVILTASAHAMAGSASGDAAIDAHIVRLATQLRCPVCQNQTIADSQAPLAVDLRARIGEMIRGGASDAQIRLFLTQRYGDFILYQPPLKASTLLLWCGPALFLVAGLFMLRQALGRASDPLREAPCADDHIPADDQPQA